MTSAKLQCDKSIGVDRIKRSRYRYPRSTNPQVSVLQRQMLLKLPYLLMAFYLFMTATISAYQYHYYKCITGNYPHPLNQPEERTHCSLGRLETLVPPFLRRWKHPHTLMASTDSSTGSIPLPTEPTNNESLSQSSQPDDVLMYVLGVNLARQLGDIRPLLISPTDDTDDDDENENGDSSKQQRQQQYAKELSQVTAGIVDTLIGRVNEQQQIVLLQQHGNALNALIQERA
jgi:hypothetical protein